MTDPENAEILATCMLCKDEITWQDSALSGGWWLHTSAVGYDHSARFPMNPYQEVDDWGHQVAQPGRWVSAETGEEIFPEAPLEPQPPVETRIHRAVVPLDELRVETQLDGFVRALHAEESRHNFGELELWYEARPGTPTTVMIYIYPTGLPFDHDEERAEYISTVFTNRRSLVWHVYTEVLA